MQTALVLSFGNIPAWQDTEKNGYNLPNRYLFSGAEQEYITIRRKQCMEQNNSFQKVLGRVERMAGKLWDEYITETIPLS